VVKACDDLYTRKKEKIDVSKVDVSMSGNCSNLPAIHPEPMRRILLINRDTELIGVPT
jgi:hypothetical protein